MRNMLAVLLFIMVVGTFTEAACPDDGCPSGETCVKLYDLTGTFLDKVCIQACTSPSSSCNCITPIGLCATPCSTAPCTWPEECVGATLDDISGTKICCTYSGGSWSC